MNAKTLMNVGKILVCLIFIALATFLFVRGTWEKESAHIAALAQTTPLTNERVLTIGDKVEENGAWYYCGQGYPGIYVFSSIGFHSGSYFMSNYLQVGDEMTLGKNKTVCLTEVLEKGKVKVKFCQNPNPVSEENKE